jgi:hypothetical protein
MSHASSALCREFDVEVGGGGIMGGDEVYLVPEFSDRKRNMMTRRTGMATKRHQYAKEIRK